MVIITNNTITYLVKSAKANLAKNNKQLAKMILERLTTWWANQFKDASIDIEDQEVLHDAIQDLQGLLLDSDLSRDWESDYKELMAIDVKKTETLLNLRGELERIEAVNTAQTLEIDKLYFKVTLQKTRAARLEQMLTSAMDLIDDSDSVLMHADNF